MGLRRVADVARESRRGPPVVAEFADERIGGGPIRSIVDRDGWIRVATSTWPTSTPTGCSNCRRSSASQGQRTQRGASG
jgi:hypothetical protein